MHTDNIRFDLTSYCGFQHHADRHVAHKECSLLLLGQSAVRSLNDSHYNIGSCAVTMLEKDRIN